MKFDPPLQKGIFKKRYRRFLVDVEIDVEATGKDGNDKEIITIHCPNTGSMLNCLMPESELWYQPSTDPNRKTKGTWVLATVAHDRIANVNTQLANKLVEEALYNGVINVVEPFVALEREVKYGKENSRIDIRLKHLDQDQETFTYIEVKSVTLGFEDSDIAAFPDSITSRGTKHLRELTTLAQNGISAMLIYCVNLSGIKGVRPADEIDPEYGKALRVAMENGVKVFAFVTELRSDSIKITHQVPVILD
ncbi:DNA/RNA nuclease SfsA [Ignatzschineria sp. LJL83]